MRIKEMPLTGDTVNGSKVKSSTNRKEGDQMSNTTNKYNNQQPNNQNSTNKSNVIKADFTSVKGLLQNRILVNELNKFPLTDAGNAECFALLFKGTLRYCKSIKKWMKWDGYRWNIDTDGEAHRAAIFTARARKAAATYIQNAHLKSSYENWAKKSESISTRNAMLSTATHLKSIEIQIGKFDQNPFLAGMKNGTFDLENLEFRDSKIEDYITKQFNVAYDPLAIAPRWEQFLDEVFAGDKELIAFIQRAVGYSITGDTSEQVIFICYGNGANGKSVFLDLISRLVGDYGANTSFSTFEANKRNEATNDLAALRGRRFVSVIETDQDKWLAEARVKSVTGQDLITCRFLYGEFFSYKPAFKIWMAVNHKPLIKGMDRGIWRRIKLIPFTQNFEKKADPYLIQKLIGELPGILNWSLEGLREWKLKRLGSAKAIDEGSENYRKECDLIQQWLDECTNQETDAKTNCFDAYNSYIEWCVTRGYPKWSNNSFGRAMTEKGFERKSNGKNREYVGFALEHPTYSSS